MHQRLGTDRMTLEEYVKRMDSHFRGNDVKHQFNTFYEIVVMKGDVAM